jgi:hypothetical protein
MTLHQYVQQNVHSYSCNQVWWLAIGETDHTYMQKELDHENNGL